MRASGDELVRGAGASPRQQVQRHGYNGLTAWLMAIMSELAYMRFEVEDLDAILSLQAELAKAVGRFYEDSEDQALERLLVTRDDRDSRVLLSVLGAGGFELVGMLSDPGTDTQGFVAVRRAGDEMDMAVVSFRGTENVKDWMTNLNYSLVPVDPVQPASKRSKARVHRGFQAALLSVSDQVDRLLSDSAGLPIFFTGHSLGGALATLANGMLPGWVPEACYTFGAPRVGNRAFARELRAPLYRVVNPHDPVPGIPTRLRGYRHAGVEKKLRKTSSADPWQEFWRGLAGLWPSRWRQPTSSQQFYDKVDLWHHFRVYRKKLKVWPDPTLSQTTTNRT